MVGLPGWISPRTTASRAQSIPVFSCYWHCPADFSFQYWLPLFSFWQWPFSWLFLSSWLPYQSPPVDCSGTHVQRGRAPGDNHSSVQCGCVAARGFGQPKKNLPAPYRGVKKPSCTELVKHARVCLHEPEQVFRLEHTERTGASVGFGEPVEPVGAAVCRVQHDRYRMP